MIKIVNLRGGIVATSSDIDTSRAFKIIRVDRQSALGNPFHMENPRDRDKVCDKYKIWFYERVRLKDSVSFNEELENLISLSKDYDIYLACWCFPKKCHSETIKEYLENGNS